MYLDLARTSLGVILLCFAILRRITFKVVTSGDCFTAVSGQGFDNRLARTEIAAS